MLICWSPTVVTQRLSGPSEDTWKRLHRRLDNAVQPEQFHPIAVVVATAWTSGRPFTVTAAKRRLFDAARRRLHGNDDVATADVIFFDVVVGYVIVNVDFARFAFRMSVGTIGRNVSAFVLFFLFLLVIVILLFVVFLFLLLLVLGPTPRDLCLCGRGPGATALPWSPPRRRITARLSDEMADLAEV